LIQGAEAVGIWPLRHVWLIVEPNASDDLAATFNPVARVYYGFSTFVCVPNAKSQDGGYPTCGLHNPASPGPK
jgi:hypothetical protein